MADTRRIILVVGLVVLGLAILGGILAAAGAPDEAWTVFLLPISLVLNPITLVIVLVVFLVRRNNKGQSQQQQVVIHYADGSTRTPGPTNDAPPGPQLRCPRCKCLNADAARFCGACGLSFQPKPSSTGPRSRTP